MRCHADHHLGVVARPWSTLLRLSTEGRCNWFACRVNHSYQVGVFALWDGDVRPVGVRATRLQTRAKQSGGGAQDATNSRLTQTAPTVSPDTRPTLLVLKPTPDLRPLPIFASNGRNLRNRCTIVVRSETTISAAC